MNAKAKKIDFDSTVNQEIKGRFVAREVYTCFSYEMNAILKQAANGGNSDLPDYEQIENLYEYKCPECGDGAQSIDAFENEQSDGKSYQCPSCNATFDEEPENEPQEIFEWWIVSEFLYDKLKAKGYPVLEWGTNFYWGRCTTGQAIMLDSVINTICSEMEILDGQQYSWSK